MNKNFSPPLNVKELLDSLTPPEAAVVTGGMPYANGPIHLGHLAGAMIPPDIMARYLRMWIGEENVLFVSGNDDHGSTSEVAALKANKPIREFIDSIHAEQESTTKSYNISYDIFSGTSQANLYPIHKEISQDFLRKLYSKGLLEKKVSKQWFDPQLSRFLQDRNVTGTCPKCGEKAYADNCEVCGAQFEPFELITPTSSLSGATPFLKDTAHFWLNMWSQVDKLKTWIASKQKEWRKGVFNEVYETVKPSFQIDKDSENILNSLKETLPSFKSRYAAGKKIVVVFENKSDFTLAKDMLENLGVTCFPLDGWAHRSITRDVSWGIPVPEELDPEMKGKTLYVWPDSLIAPISFSKLALKRKGQEERLSYFWKNPKAKIYQFLGQDNVYFYTLMQGSMWLGVGEYTLSDVFSVFHLMVDGKKMSKSTGNYYTGDQLLKELKFSSDQVRYFLATLGLSDKQSDFSLENFKERNRFLAGPMNASIEKPISACHSKFNSRIPDGKLLEKIEQETFKIVKLYVKNMEKAEHVVLLGQIENYARTINSLFAQYKPHDDRQDLEARKNALFSSFYVLKNLMIMLYPLFLTRWIK